MKCAYVAAFTLALGALGPVWAGQRCADLPSPLYVAGTDAVAAYLQALAPALLNDADQVTLVFQGQGSCAGVEAVVQDTDPQVCRQGACMFGSASFYTQDGDVKACDLPPQGAHVDVALSNVFAQTCPGLGGGVPAGLADLPGPVVPLALVASRSSNETSIQAAEAHFVFGLGAMGGIAPWDQPGAIIVQDARAGDQVLLGLHVQVPPGRFQGVAAMDAADVLDKLGAADPQHGIGFVPTLLADTRRSDVKILAYQALGQRGAFFPDRTHATFDKQNVRDGHYPLWGYLHVIGRGDGAQTDRLGAAVAQRLADLVLGRSAPSGQDPLLMQVQAGLVPQCAMKVARLSDASPLIPAIVPTPCGCFFEKNVPMGATSCTACTDDKPCGGGHCRSGYCEVR